MIDEESDGEVKIVNNKDKSRVKRRFEGMKKLECVICMSELGKKVI